ncbi:MAG: hypothetical protein KDJ38_14445 [Gammaproteobacteria bacterium]|nr:hypothetical protein [Gammaproteobacteria bacterium]
MKPDLQKLKTVEDFYAHAIGLEHEFEERLTDLGGCLDAHNNPDSAMVFRKALDMHSERVRQLEAMSEGLQLPRVAPWDYAWHYTVNLEIICMASVHYLMTPLEALEMVEEKLAMAHDFYKAVKERYQGSPLGEAARNALAGFDQELQAFRRWHEALEASVVPEDHDPPNQPL